ncbi:MULTISPECIES: hypothetical protein [Sphingobium]|jgi:hypothetical protein|uniref:hypothetical protein n=1 Tax=Sphingobium TaxID=165695 RepID=UPI0011107DBB|nr:MULTISPECIES: hypothetical protein [Sphingobium]
MIYFDREKPPPYARMSRIVAPLSLPCRLTVASVVLDGDPDRDPNVAPQARGRRVAGASQVQMAQNGPTTL